MLVVWKLDRLGRNLAHLVNTVQDLSARGVGLRVLAGQGAQIDTTTAAGCLVFGIFAALAEFERELIRERTVAGLKAARGSRTQGRQEGSRCRKRRCGWPRPRWRTATPRCRKLCRELGIRPVTLAVHLPRVVCGRGRDPTLSVSRRPWSRRAPASAPSRSTGGR